MSAGEFKNRCSFPTLGGGVSGSGILPFEPPLRVLGGAGSLAGGPAVSSSRTRLSPSSRPGSARRGLGNGPALVGRRRWDSRVSAPETVLDGGADVSFGRTPSFGAWKAGEAPSGPTS